MTPSDEAAPGMPEGYRSEEWIAEVLGVKVMTLRVWSAKGKGPPRVTVGRRPIYREAAFYAWLERQERDPEAQTEGAANGAPPSA